MSEQRPTKKSETLEVRVEHDVKLALMRKAQAEGRSASEVVRECIGAYLAEQPRETRSMLMTVWKPAAALGAASLAIVWSVLVAGPVSAAPDLRASFEAFDSDGNKAITLEEFARRSPDTMFVMKADRPPMGGKAQAFVLPLRTEVPPPPAGAEAPPEAMLRAEFLRHDRNGDGAVTFDEFEAHHVAMMKAGFSAIDKDRNGSLDRREFEAAVSGIPEGTPAARFSDIDANGDGSISEEEFFG